MSKKIKLGIIGASKGNGHPYSWSAIFNGYDAQDEYARIDPVGIGEHEFKVYFNRAMDTTIDPHLFYEKCNF
jgi:hypothetical protein